MLAQWAGVLVRWGVRCATTFLRTSVVGDQGQALKILQKEISASRVFANDHNERALWLADAISFNSEKCARYLVNEHDALNSCKEIFSLLQPAIMTVKTGNVELLKFLFEKGVPPDQHDSKHETPLSHAVELKNEEIVKICLAAGANPEGSTKAGVTPLQKAIQGNEPMIALALLEYNANCLSSG